MFWAEFDENGIPQYSYNNYCNVAMGCFESDITGEVEEEHLRFLNEVPTQ